MPNNSSDPLQNIVDAVRQAAGAEPNDDTITDKIINYVALLHTKSIPTQMGIGGGVGLTTGYLFTRGSKAAAAVLGVSLLAFQFASYKGYIYLDEGRINDDIRNLAHGIERRLSGKRRIRINKDIMVNYISDNRWLIGGFTAGWLIGFSLA